MAYLAHLTIDITYYKIKREIKILYSLVLYNVNCEL